MLVFDTALRAGLIAANARLVTASGKEGVTLAWEIGALVRLTGAVTRNFVLKREDTEGLPVQRGSELDGVERGDGILDESKGVSLSMPSDGGALGVAIEGGALRVRRKGDSLSVPSEGVPLSVPSGEERGGADEVSNLGNRREETAGRTQREEKDCVLACEFIEGSSATFPISTMNGQTEVELEEGRSTGVLEVGVSDNNLLLGEPPLATPQNGANASLSSLTDFPRDSQQGAESTSGLREEGGSASSASEGSVNWPKIGVSERSVNRHETGTEQNEEARSEGSDQLEGRAAAGVEENGPVGKGSVGQGSVENGSAETISVETDSTGIGSVGTGSEEIGSRETGSAETGLVRTGSVETGSVGIGSAEIGSVGIGLADTGSVGIGSAEIGSVGTASAKTGAVGMGLVGTVHSDGNALTVSFVCESRCGIVNQAEDVLDSSSNPHAGTADTVRASPEEAASGDESRDSPPIKSKRKKKWKADPSSKSPLAGTGRFVGLKRRKELETLVKVLSMPSRGTRSVSTGLGGQGSEGSGPEPPSEKRLEVDIRASFGPAWAASAERKRPLWERLFFSAPPGRGSVGLLAVKIETSGARLSAEIGLSEGLRLLGHVLGSLLALLWRVLAALERRAWEAANWLAWGRAGLLTAGRGLTWHLQGDVEKRRRFHDPFQGKFGRYAHRIRSAETSEKH
jgi:hypothetical protein